MKFKITFRHLLLFSITFFALVVIGTVTHEAGHIAVARMLGYETRLTYNSMDWNSDYIYKKLDSIYVQHSDAIDRNLPFEGRKDFEQTITKLKGDTLLILAGGPLQTIFTGTIGLLLLYSRRGSIRLNGVGITDWAGIFLSLFWLREIYNPIMAFTKGVINGNGDYFGGDEPRISLLMKLPEGAIPIVLALAGGVTCFLVVFRIIPAEKRAAFILSGLIGGLAGLYFWTHLAGPALLPK